MKPSRYLKSVLGLAIGAVFLYLAVRRVELGSVSDAVQSVSPGWVAIVLALVVIGFLLRSLRWQMMFSGRNEGSFNTYFNAFMLGALGNTVFPGRIGDLVRGVVLGRDLAFLGVRGALASIVLEKTLDGIVLLFILAIALVIAPLPAWLVRVGGFGMLIFGAAFVFLLVLSLLEPRSREKQASAERSFEWFMWTQVERFSTGLHALKDLRRFFSLVGASILIWGFEAMIIFSAFRMFGIDLPIDAALVCLVFLSIGTMLPAAPGFVGTYQFFLISALAIYGVSENVAMAMSVVLNTLVILSTVIVALAVAGSRVRIIGRSFVAGSEN